MMFHWLFDKGGKQMYASSETLFEIMDAFPGILRDDGKTNAICFAIIDSVLHAIRDKDEEPLTDYRLALSRVITFIQAQPGYENDPRMPFLASRLCGLLEVTDLALKQIVPIELIRKIKSPKNAAFVEILLGQEMELGELATKLGQPEAAVTHLLAEICEVVIIQRSGNKQFVRLSLRFLGIYLVKEN